MEISKFHYEHEWINVEYNCQKITTYINKCKIASLINKEDLLFKKLFDMCGTCFQNTSLIQHHLSLSLA